MAKYKIWDKKEDFYTLGVDPKTGKSRWTAEEYIAAKAPWAANPNVKIIVGGGAVNGTMFLEFEATKEFYVNQGCDFADCTTDDEILATMEAWDNRVIEPEVTAEERTAAALEYMAMSSLPDAEATETV